MNICELLCGIALEITITLIQQGVKTGESGENTFHTYRCLISRFEVSALGHKDTLVLA